MLIIKMNLRCKRIKEIDVNHNIVRILFLNDFNNKQLYPIHLEGNKQQFKQIYNKIISQERKERKQKAKWMYKR